MLTKPFPRTSDKFSPLFLLHHSSFSRIYIQNQTSDHQIPKRQDLTTAKYNPQDACKTKHARSPIAGRKNNDFEFEVDGMKKTMIVATDSMMTKMERSHLLEVHLWTTERRG
jgi:hypothetical protein